MIKGKWVILAVLMGLATWPLLRIRRRHEIHKTEALLEGIQSACKQYRTHHGRYPESLDLLNPRAPLEVLDSWRRPIRYEVIHTEGRVRARLWSLGPSEADSADDISVELP